jgi:hypothetical protein
VTIVIRDYMSVSPKGRACKPRHTEYETDDYQEAYRLHAEAIERGDIEKPYKVAGWARRY